VHPQLQRLEIEPSLASHDDFSVQNERLLITALQQHLSAI